VDCIEWGGACRKTDGYGQVQAMRFGRRISRAHVLAWIDANGRLPEPDEIVRHSCDNPPCINPVHLLIGSKSDNAKDAAERGQLWQAKITHCPQGHEYTDDNIYWRVTKAGGRARHCKTCTKARAREQTLRRQAERSDNR
jgi:hypothetical protein